MTDTTLCPDCNGLITEFDVDWGEVFLLVCSDCGWCAYWCIFPQPVTIVTV